jgi:hypothetical protein
VKLDIHQDSFRGYLTNGKYYSNGKKIRLIKDIGYDEITYAKIENGIEVGTPKVVKAQTFEAWAKYPVSVNMSV